MLEVAVGNDDAFDDDAIRNELRKIVEAFTTQYLGELSEVEVACRAEAGASDEQKQRVYSGFKNAKSIGEHRIQMMLDFIERR